MRKILVLRGGALGDFIVTLPALALLRQRWPEARIELAGNARAAELGRTRGLLDAVHSQHEARWSTLYSNSALPAEFARWLGDFDLVVNYWPDPEGDLRRRFPLRANQIFLTADAMPVKAPAAAHYCEPLRALGLETREFFFRLNPRVSTTATVNASLTRRATEQPDYISIHPGSGSPRKNWPIKNWLALLDRLPLPVSMILGEAELPLSSAFASTGHEILANRPLEELVAHLSASRLFVGHDSGISHLAAACGAPCVLLFGSTAPNLWAPPAPNVRVLHQHPDLNSLPVESVERAVAAALADQR